MNVRELDFLAEEYEISIVPKMRIPKISLLDKQVIIFIN